MEFLKAQLERVKQQLSGLNASQKMLVCALVVIMGITFVYLARYAGTAEMEPVLDQSLSMEDLASIKSYLASKGFEPKVVGDRVLVPAEKRMEALADLTFMQMLPRNSESGFDLMFKQMSPWDSTSKNDVMWNEAKQITLAQIIRRWPGVSNASVMIDNRPRKTFSSTDTGPSATVDIKTRGGSSGRPDKKLVNAAADLIKGSVANIESSAIKVIIDGMSQQTRDGNSAMAGSSDLMEIRQSYEKYYAEKIQQQLAWLNAGVFVQVTVDVNARAIIEEKTTVDPNGIVYKPIKTNTREDESHAQPKAAEPGVGANSTATVDSGGGESNSSTTAEERNEYQLETSKTLAKSQEGAGKATVLAATVRVPRSYFVRVFKELNPGGKEPDAAALKPVIEEELPRIRADVKACTGIVDEKMVAVESYIELNPELQVASTGGVSSAASAIASNSFVSMVSTHAKEIAVGILAVVSLFMVMMMVRKSGPATAVAGSRAGGGMGGMGGGLLLDQPMMSLDTGEALVGEASEGGGLLDGMELDEDAVRTQQMVGQVSTLVKDNPEAAANLVKRWLDKT